MKRQSKKSIRCITCLTVLLLLAGCEKYYLSLTDQNIDVDYLASTHVGTPDKRQQNPPFGEMIVIDWRIPKELLKQNPVIDLHVIYGNYTEKTFQYPVKKRMGYVTYKDLNEEYANSKGIITYSADIRLDDGTIYKDWKHQLWANLITISEEPSGPAAPPPAPKEDSSPENSDEEKESQEQKDDDYQEDENDAEDPNEDEYPSNSDQSFSNCEGDQNDSDDIAEERDDDSDSWADSISSSVEDQLMQGSVTDTEDFIDEVSSDNS